MFRVEVDRLSSPEIRRRMDRNELYQVRTYTNNEIRQENIYWNRWNEDQIKQFMRLFLNRTIVDRDDPNRMWYDNYFERIERTATGIWEVHILQEWLD